jgi:radical SAM-linked protein
MNESMDYCQDPSETTPAETPNKAPEQPAPGIGVLVGFRVFGLARFLSHAELMRVFQRACVRADLALEYSHGYNPRPRLSLPLPKPVGVESEGDLLCLRLKDSGFTEEEGVTEVSRRLSDSLPEGLEILSVQIVPRKASYQAEAADYRFILKETPASDELMRVKTQTLLACESLVVDRRDGDEGTASRRVDVRPYLESIEVADHEIKVHCRIFQTGSIRVGEILELLELTKEQLAGPIRRTAIQWRQTSSLSNECDSDRPPIGGWKGP